MWVMTTGGFVSAVAHRDNPANVMVRGRDRRSLEIMLESIVASLARSEQPEQVMPEIQSQPKGEHWDYPHRVVISKVLFQYFLIEEVSQFLEYTNFKTAATGGRGEAYHKALMNVWIDMRAMTEPEYRPAPIAYTGKYGTTYHGSSAWSGGKGSEDTSTKPTQTIGQYSGTLYDWDDDGKMIGSTPLARKTSIHDLPEGVDPDDDVIDVDEEGAPVHAYAADLAPLPTDVELLIDQLDEAAGSDAIYHVNGIATELSEDELFEQWLARRDRDDAIAELEADDRLELDRHDRRGGVEAEFVARWDNDDLDRIDAEADARFRQWMEEKKNAALQDTGGDDEPEVEAVPNTEVAATPE